MVDRLLKVALAGSTWVLWLLLALSVLSIATMLERFVFFLRHKDDIDELRTKLSRLLAKGDFETAETFLSSSRSLEARIVAKALAWRRGGPDAVLDAAASELGAVKKELERGTNLLGTLGNNTPFVGLFGTVLGVIEAFHSLAGGAAKAQMGNVMSGISEALVATGVGLVVALPAVVAYNIVQKRIGDIESDALSLAKLVTAALRVPAKRERETPEAREASPTLAAAE